MTERSSQDNIQLSERGARSITALPKREGKRKEKKKERKGTERSRKLVADNQDARHPSEPVLWASLILRFIIECSAENISSQQVVDKSTTLVARQSLGKLRPD